MQHIDEVKQLPVKPFFFGCEADDPMNVWAFDNRVNPRFLERTMVEEAVARTTFPRLVERG